MARKSSLVFYSIILMVLLVSCMLFLMYEKICLKNTYMSEVVRERIRALEDNGVLKVVNKTHFIIGPTSINRLLDNVVLVENSTIIDLAKYMMLRKYFDKYKYDNLSKAIFGIDFVIKPPYEVIKEYIIENKPSLIFSIPLVPRISEYVSGQSRFQIVTLIMLDVADIKQNHGWLNVYIYKIDQLKHVAEFIKFLSNEKPLLLYFSTWGYVRKHNGTVVPISNTLLMELLALEYIARKFHDNLSVAILLAPRYENIHDENMPDYTDSTFKTLNNPQTLRLFAGDKISNVIRSGEDLWYVSILYYKSKPQLIIDTVPTLQCVTDTIKCWITYIELQLIYHKII